MSDEMTSDRCRTHLALPAAVCDTSMESLPKKGEHRRVELVVECVPLETGRIDAELGRSSSQVLRARRQEREVLGVRYRAELRWAWQLAGDRVNARGRDAVTAALRTPKLDRHTNLVE